MLIGHFLLAVTLTLGVPFRDGAVLQRGVRVPVWGRADAGTEVSVAFAGQTVTGRTGADGRWRVALESLTNRSLLTLLDNICYNAVVQF